MRMCLLKKSALLVAIPLLLIRSDLKAATISEDFSTDPATRGWKRLGDQDLFRWDSTNGSTDVSWDSSKSNSFFCLPLQNLGAEDDFSVSFQLRLKDYVAGINPAKRATFELSFGFFNMAQASASNFVRGSGIDSPNLVEFS